MTFYADHDHYDRALDELATDGDPRESEYRPVTRPSKLLCELLSRTIVTRPSSRVTGTAPGGAPSPAAGPVPPTSEDVQAGRGHAQPA